MAMTEISDRIRVPFAGDDAALTVALQAGQRSAQEALYHRYATHVRNVLVRVLGTNVDLKDHLHNTFIQIFTGVESVRDGTCLKQWLTRVAVFTAIAHIKYSQRKRWLTFMAPEEVPPQEYHGADDEQREAVYQVYSILKKMTAEDRAIFCLRVIEGMQLKEMAEVFEVSLATIKRRITHAQERFAFHLRSNPALEEWIRNESTGRFRQREAG